MKAKVSGWDFHENPLNRGTLTYQEPSALCLLLFLSTMQEVMTVWYPCSNPQETMKTKVTQKRIAEQQWSQYLRPKRTRAPYHFRTIFFKTGLPTWKMNAWACNTVPKWCSHNSNNLNEQSSFHSITWLFLIYVHICIILSIHLIVVTLTETVTFWCSYVALIGIQWNTTSGTYFSNIHLLYNFSTWYVYAYFIIFANFCLIIS